MKSNRLKLLYEIIKFKCLYFHENWDSVYYLLMEPNPLLPITRESSLRSSAATHSFSLGSPQYTLATAFACFNFHITKNIPILSPKKRTLWSITEQATVSNGNIPLWSLTHCQGYPKLQSLWKYHTASWNWSPSTPLEAPELQTQKKPLLTFLQTEQHSRQNRRELRIMGM